jgi:hypothetical protein
MGAGEFYAGAGTAGFDPVTTVPPTAIPRAPTAIAFDLATGRHLFANGAPVPQHPVDQAVLHALGIEVGSLQASPTVGQRFRTIRGLATARGPAAARAETEAALASLLAAGDIELQSVAIAPGRGGVPEIQIAYKNLRSGTSRTLSR